jgi:hypothetical protein
VLVLADFRPEADGLLRFTGEIPVDRFRLPMFQSVFTANVNRAVSSIESALIVLAPAARADLLQYARFILRARVLPRVNGCAVGTGPDANDWVLDCGDQRRMQTETNSLLDAIEQLKP